MAYTIVDEIRLNTQASRLEALASKYDGIISDVSSSSSKLGAWDSPAAEQWRSSVSSLVANASGSASELRSIAQSIRAYTASHHYLLEEEIGDSIEKVVEKIIK